MDVTKILEQDHRDAESLFDQIPKAEGAKRQSLIDELNTALRAHMELEERVPVSGDRARDRRGGSAGSQPGASARTTGSGLDARVGARRAGLRRRPRIREGWDPPSRRGRGDGAVPEGP